MEQEELLYSYTYTKLSDLLARKMLLRKIQLTFSAAEASGSRKKNPQKNRVLQARFFIRHGWVGTARSAAGKETATQPH